MEIKSTEQEENIKNNTNEIENEQLGKNDLNSVNSENKNKNISSSNLRGSDETHFSSDNKSMSAEKPDKSEDKIQFIQSTLTHSHKKNNSQNSELRGLKISSEKKEIKLPHKFNIFLERVEDFQKKKTQNINQLHQNYEDSIKKLMKNPEITKKSRIIDKKNSKPKFLDRIKDQQIKQKQRKEKLIEKINLEKLKKKEEIEKPLKFHIKQKEDKKFMKAYKIMMKREKEVKERFKVFNSVVKEYTMKDCTFAPKINKNEDGNKGDNNESNGKNDITERIIKRMYKDEIKNKIKRKDELVKKYKPCFHPKINANSGRLSRNWKAKLSKKNQSVNYEMNNDMDKLSVIKERTNKSSFKSETNDEKNKNEDK